MSLYVVARPGLTAGSFSTPAQAAISLEPTQAESCESLFSALDGRDLVVLGRKWRVGVFSVVELAGRRYAQLSLEGTQQFLLTLRLTPATTARRVIPAVLAWLSHPTGSGDVIEID